jgi:hypothetical protein
VWNDQIGISGHPLMEWSGRARANAAAVTPPNGLGKELAESRCGAATISSASPR